MPHSNSSEALYEHIQRDIIAKIQDGTYGDDQRIPSENEISKIYGVSRITATKALTELSLNGYIYRIQGKGSFVVPAESRPQEGLKEGDPIPVGLIIPENGEYHSARIISGVSQSLAFPEYFLTTVISRFPGQEDAALNFFLKSRYQGLLIFPGDFEFYSDIILKMHLNRYPFVLIDRIFTNLSCHCVSCDNEKGTRLAVEYFYRHGHRKIAFVGGSSLDEQVTSLRHSSYLKAMALCGLQPRFYNDFAHPQDPRGARRRFFQDLLEGEITAVLASNSGAAVYLDALCRERGLRIPQDLSVICFDNPAFLGPAKRPFTFIEQQSYEIGVAAARMLKRLIGGETDVPMAQVLEPELVEGETVRTV